MTSKKRRSSQSANETTQSKRSRVSIDESDDTPKTVDLGNEESSTNSKARKDSASSNGASVNKDGESEEDISCRFVGAAVPDDEARRRWPHRYEKQRMNDQEEALLARSHYLEAEVEGCLYNLYDDVHVKAEDGKPNYIARIVEFFESTDKDLYFTAQWFYRAEDTVIKDHANLIDEKRVFQSDIRDDNPLECLVCKLSIARLKSNIDEAEKPATPTFDFFYNMKYVVPYSTIENLRPENAKTSPESTISSEASSDVGLNEAKIECREFSVLGEYEKDEMTLLDLYSGCGAMSTGLCLGAALSGVNLITRWTVDINKHACESLKLNHPGTQVRNESADEFLTLLKEWEKLCKGFALLGTGTLKKKFTATLDLDDIIEDNSKIPSGEFEVGSLVGICFGDPNDKGKKKLHFKVRWKGYGPSDDTWEPVDGLSKCQGKIKDFVTSGYRSGILPLPGDVDVICGGPPCQGISGFNRFRNKEKPLEDPKNKQLVVFMNIVDFLKPKYVLMENVVDILRFAGGFLGRYALSRLVAMGYQARLGMMAAGCYGLPQFRMRAFFWGACTNKKLPQFPLPTHDVVVRGGVPNEFEQNTVAYDENHRPNLEKALLLGDAISDLPPVTNYEIRDEMPYVKSAETDFQKEIRLRRHEIFSFAPLDPMASQSVMLYDHRPLQLNDDDYHRVCQIPKKKGACFRDLPGVVVGENNKVEWDGSVERVLLPSGKPLVPDYAMSFIGGTSSKPFSRLWWDETVPTVVTRAEPHNQTIMHPEQDRVLSVRENARLQGFSDYYKLCGPIKERYIQVGNAVAVPVARALGYALGLAWQGSIDDRPLLTLPSKFPCSLYPSWTGTTEVQDVNR